MALIEKIKEVINTGFIFNETETVVGLSQLHFVSRKKKKRTRPPFCSGRQKKSFALDCCFGAKDFYQNLSYFDLNAV